MGQFLTADVNAKVTVVRCAERSHPLPFYHLLPLVTGLSLLLSSCGLFPPSEAQTGRPEKSGQSDGPVAVETARAQVGTLTATLDYTGTTQPQQQVALRAQTAGQVVALNGHVGDPVQRGEVLAEIDGGLLTARVNEAQAELFVRQSEVAEDQVSITDAQATVAQAQATRAQAKIDADRLRKLANQGALSQQAAEAAELAWVSAEQAVTSAQAQVEARQEAIAAATGRVNAQQALVAEAREQLRWVYLQAPLSATVLTRQVEPGDYVQPGTTLLELGDLSTLKVTVQVSELDLGRLTLGQPAQIRLDAFPDIKPITGRITRISPVADATSRLVTVEVTMTNPDNRIGSGLLARVQFTTAADDQVVIPTSALAHTPQENTIFVIAPKNDPTDGKTQVTARPVKLGKSRQGQVEILSGLAPNDIFVVHSDQPLKTGQPVRLSILSEVKQDEN